MALFKYEIVDKTGAVSTGSMEAETKDAAISQLREMGYYITEIKEEKSSGIMARLKNISFKKKVKLGDLSLFSRQLASMLEAGIPLVRALNTLSNQISNPTLRKTVEDVAGEVEGGSSLSEALERHPQVFNKLYVGMVSSGEVGGTLEEALTRLSQQLDKDKALQDNIKSASYYPAMVTVFAFLILIGMMIFIVPVFIQMIPPDATLPLPTRIIIAISNSLINYWFIWVLLLGGIVIFVRYYINSTRGKYFIGRMKFKLPIFGDLFQKALIARFSRTLSTLFAGGLPVLQALESASQASGSVILEEHVAAAREEIQEGSNIADPLARSELFPPMVIQMISIGEESGQLSSLLDRAADFYEREVEALTKGLTAMIEPFLLVFVGLIVGSIVISLYLPIFTSLTEIGEGF